MNVAEINLDTMKIVAIHASESAAGKNAGQETHLAGEASDLMSFSGPELIKLFNQNRTSDMVDVKKFADKSTAVKRILALFDAATPTKASKKKTSKKVSKKAKSKSSGKTRAPKVQDADKLNLFSDSGKQWMHYRDKTPVRKLPKGPSRRLQCFYLMKQGMLVGTYIKLAEKELGITRSQALACLAKLTEPEQVQQMVSLKRA